MLDLFTAIKVRYNATDLKDNFTAISAGEAFPDIHRPYAIAFPLTEVRKGRSNVGGYFGLSFTIQVVADDFETATRLGYLLQTRLLEPALTFAGTHDRLLLVQEGNINWRQDDQYWRAIVEFYAEVGKPGRDRSY